MAVRRVGGARVTACRNVTIRSLTLGDDTPYRLGPIKGLGIPDVRDNDVERGHADGDVGQNDHYAPRQLLFQITIGPPDSPDVDTVWDNWDTLEVAWTKSNIDLPLTVTTGGRTWTFLGRPRGLVLDDTSISKGDPILRGQAAFKGLDPTRY